MNVYYFAKLNSMEQIGYRRLIEAISRKKKYVHMGDSIGEESLAKITDALNYDHPELFYVDFKHINYMLGPMGLAYQINYNAKLATVEKAMRRLQREARAVTEQACAAGLKNDFDKCRWIHNYLVRHITYHFDALRAPERFPESYRIDGVFQNRTAVCEGIAKAFKFLCDQLGVEAFVITGTSSMQNVGQEISHAWDIVRLDGEYMHVDTTWDMNMSEASRYTRFDYFCLPDHYMEVDHIYKGYPKCGTDCCSYFKKRGRCFTGSRQLQAYLDAELEKHASVLYFRAQNRRLDFGRLQAEIQEQVSRTVAAHNSGTFTLEMIHNEAQKCHRRGEP